MQVVATDLDGTLLRSDSSLTERTRAALRAARAAGIRVVLATARPARVVADLFGPGEAAGGRQHSEQGLLDAAICGNGAARYDLVTGEHTVTHPLQPALVADVMAHVAEVLPGAFFAVETGLRVLQEAGYHYRPSMDRDRYTVLDRAELVAEPVVKVMVLIPDGGPAAAWALLEPGLGELVACTWSAGHGLADGSYPAILEISAPGVSKAAALAELCTQWSVAREQVAAVGDAPNDLPMLAWAGAGYAVANAHPEVLAAAAHEPSCSGPERPLLAPQAPLRCSCGRVLPSNDEDGVAVLLERLTAALPRSR